VLDVCRYDDLTNLHQMREGQPTVAPFVNRLRIRRGVSVAREESFHEQRTEFPTVHPSRAGERNGVLWGKYCDVEKEGLSRFNTDAGNLDIYNVGRDSDTSEPVLIPKTGGAEGDVWIVQRAFSPRRGQHYTAVFDGSNFPDLPVATIWHGAKLPITYHGAWRGADGRT
jgi:carotenoid cleavage dioxygenase-like enzyme